MSSAGLDNAAPRVFEVAQIHRNITPEDEEDEIDALEVFGELFRHYNYAR